MANYFGIISAPDSHIEFLVGAPETLLPYLEGQEVEPPEPKKVGLLKKLFGGANDNQQKAEVPSDWPTEEPEMIGPEINHRNVDLYHRFLNGSENFVSGSGSIFQTWLTPREHDAIEIGPDRESFAFRSDLVPDLQRLVSNVDLIRVTEQYSTWLKKEGKDYEPDSEECGLILDEFAQFSQSLQEVVEAGHGIIWISC